MLKNILIGIIGLVVVVIGLGFVLPDKAHIEREIVINAPQEEVFALISDFEQWDRWSPWAEIDPDAEYSLTGEGVGQRMAWQSDHPDVGSGSQVITEMEAPSRVAMNLDFGDMGKAKAAFALSPMDDGATKVVWSFDSNMRQSVPVHMKPMSTYMGFMMDGFLGPAYEEGLANLKRVAEQG